MKAYNEISGGVTAPGGYRAAGIPAGLKASALDLAVLVSDQPAAVAGVFTTNKIQGAPVGVCRDRVRDGSARAVVINSGNANACNGPAGHANARTMGRLLAEQLDIPEAESLVCSTGTIGIPLPMDRIEAGIGAAIAQLSADGHTDAATAIMTTDTVSKEMAVAIALAGKTVRIGGMTKGAGMIEPNMATMLAFLTTDAAVEPMALQRALVHAVGLSFNKISIDGDQSCNDTVLLFANGASGGAVLDESHPEWDLFTGALDHLSRELAFMMVRDGEGVTKFVTVTVNGAVSDSDAELAARAVANSLLVKTSWFGCDPNWGRIIDAVGYSGADVKEEQVEITFDDEVIVSNGCRVPQQPLKRLEAVLAQDAFTVTVDLHLGAGRDTVYTCDCSDEYVRINSEYTT